MPSSTSSSSAVDIHKNRSPLLANITKKKCKRRVEIEIRGEIIVILTIMGYIQELDGTYWR